MWIWSCYAVCRTDQSHDDSLDIQLGLCSKGDQGDPRVEPNRCVLSSPTTNHNPVSKKLMDLRSLGLFVQLLLSRGEPYKDIHTSCPLSIERASVWPLTPSTPTLLPFTHVQLRYLKLFIKDFPPEHGKVPNRSKGCRLNKGTIDGFSFIWPIDTYNYFIVLEKRSHHACKHRKQRQLLFFVLCPWPLPLLIPSLGRGHDGGVAGRG